VEYSRRGKINTVESEDKFVLERRFTTDGKENTYTWGNAQARSKVNWSEMQLIITSWIETRSGTVESKETWNLDNDQKTLIITRELLNSRAKTVCKRQ